MDLLPSELHTPRLRIPKTTGPLVVPSWYDDEDLLRLARLFQLAGPPIEHHLHLSIGDLALLHAENEPVADLSDTLVTVWGDEDYDKDGLPKTLLSLGASTCIIRIRDATPGDYAWLEKAAKAPLISIVRMHVKKKTHPLAAFGIAQLPVARAGGSTTDPLELLDLLEATVRHRLENAGASTGADAWKRSLGTACAEHLAARVEGIPERARRDALDVLMGIISADDGEEHFVTAARSLEDLGLVRAVGRDVSIGPLARRVQEDGTWVIVRGALPARSFSDKANRKIDSGLQTTDEGDLEPAFELAGRGEVVGSSQERIQAIGLKILIAWVDRSWLEAGEMLGKETAKHLNNVLSVLVELPRAIPEVPNHVAGVLRTALVRLDDAATSSKRDRAAFARFAGSVIRFYSARGPSRFQEMQEARDVRPRTVPLLSKDVLKRFRAGQDLLFAVEMEQIGRNAEALNMTTRATRVFELAAGRKEVPGDAHSVSGIAFILLGHMYKSMGQVEQAREAYENAFAINERLAQFAPDRADYQNSLSISYASMGDLRFTLGLNEQAHEAYMNALAIYERLAQSEPDRADFKRRLSLVYGRLGDTYRRWGKVEQAREAHMKFLAIIEGLAQAEPDRFDYQHDLFMAYIRAGSWVQGEQASEAYKKSLVIIERLAQAEPNHVHYQVNLSTTLAKVGIVDAGKAEKNFARAIKILRSLKESGRLAPEYDKRIPWVEGLIRERASKAR